jgi:hypothetical protein
MWAMTAANIHCKYSKSNRVGRPMSMGDEGTSLTYKIAAPGSPGIGQISAVPVSIRTGPSGQGSPGRRWVRGVIVRSPNQPP